MAWVGLRDAFDSVYSRAGLGVAQRDAGDLNAVLPQGTLMIELDLMPGLDGQVLLSYFADFPWTSGLSLSLDAKGLLTFSQRQGAHRRSYLLQTALTGRTPRVTLTYTWDAPNRQGFFSVAVAETEDIWHCSCAAPLPLSLRDAVRLMADHGRCRMAEGLVFAAIADEIMPHGSRPTLFPDALVETPQGPQRIGDLRAGSLVSGADGQVSQVRWAGSLVLPSRGRFAPLRLRAPHYGAQVDLLCTRDQRIRMKGSAVDYLFDTDCVSLGIGNLPRVVAAPDPQMTRTYAQVLLDRPVPMMVSGLRLEGLDARRLIQDPMLRAHSVLAGLPDALMPRVTDARVPVLRDLEAQTLGRLEAA